MPNYVLGWTSGGSIAENSANSVPLGVLNLDSAAFPASLSSITITGPAGYVFSVNLGTFEVTVNQGFNFEAAASVPLGIAITFSDSSTNGSESLSLGVTDVNEVPVLSPYLGVSTSNISQGAPSGREVARVSVADPDAGDSVALSLLGPDASYFVLDGLRVRLANGVTLDHSLASTLNFTVRGTDSGGLTGDQAFTVNVLDTQGTVDGLQAALGGSGGSVGLAVRLTDDGPRFTVGGNSIVFTGGGTVNLADGVLGFGAGSELAGIERVFQGLQGRAAFGSEMMILSNHLTHGGQLSDVMAFIMGGAEFSTYVQSSTGSPDAASLGNADFIELLYGRVLGRGSDSGGLAFWTAVLDGEAMSRGDVALGFCNSGEAQSRFAASTQKLWAVDAQGYQVRSLYDVALNREVDAGGLAFWSQILEQGVGIGVVADFLVESSEFQARIVGLTTTQVLQQFYLDGLERSADSPGLNYWVAVVDAGLADWSDVLVGFAMSSEQDGQFAGYRNGADIFPV